MVHTYQSKPSHAVQDLKLPGLESETLICLHCCPYHSWLCQKLRSPLNSYPSFGLRYKDARPAVHLCYAYAFGEATVLCELSFPSVKLRLSLYSHATLPSWLTP